MISLIVNKDIGVDARIKRFFKGIYNLRPSRPKYECTWDPKIVLDYFINIGDNEALDFKILSKKLICLLKTLRLMTQE